MGLLPDELNRGLRMRRECRERCPRHRLQRKPLVSDPDTHQGTCVTHVPWCMSESLTGGGGGKVPSIPGACATRNFAYLVRGPLHESLQANNTTTTKQHNISMGHIVRSSSRHIVWFAGRQQIPMLLWYICTFTRGSIFIYHMSHPHILADISQVYFTAKQNTM